MPSLATRMACATLNCCGPRPSESSSATTIAQLSSSRLVAEGTPHALELAGVGIEHDDAVIAVAVGHEQLVGLRQHPRIGGRCTLAVSALPLLWLLLADLQDELAVLRELQELVVGDRLRARRAGVGQLLPPSQTKPLWSMWMPCSRSGHS